MSLGPNLALRQRSARQERPHSTQPTLEIVVGQIHRIEQSGQEQWIACAGSHAMIASGSGDYVFRSQPGQELGAMLSGGITEVIQLAPQFGSEPLPVVTDLAYE